MPRNSHLNFEQASNADLINQIHCYLSHFPGEASRIALLLKQVNDTTGLTDRKTLPGHITASGIVIEGGKFLMIFHPFLKKWLHPGGHIERGESPLEAVRREVLEETGVSTIPHSWHKKYGIPFDIDVHTIPANPDKSELIHTHYDFRYILNKDGASIIKTENDCECVWVEYKELKEPNLKNLITKLNYNKII